ncbi:hypothetical protein J31TS4_06490 [Paenibacillus sp. J31TS4]|uniref:FtsX-like permease family protein n=1 Tax=Paenibacillus sp. J31TS4 TaxID=2807195 RepID=UPI001B169750|nr:FtsX-like permease family protein [Paenibacillus sp. J31TS4]GIP37369.1 hypothetical protein J31TS4_06490 [Paenibacillus sp. J31TS4]
MTLRQLAWRNLMRRKTRSLLTLLSIVIGVASILGVIASVESAKKALPQYLQSVFGKADFTVQGTDAYFRENAISSIQAVEGTASVAMLKHSAKLKWDAPGITDIQKRVDLRGYSDTDTALTAFQVVKGKLGTDGAVISDRTARVWGADVGDTIALVTDTGLREIKIAAVVRYTIELMGPSSWTMAKYHPWTVVVPLSAVQDWFGLAGKIEGISIKILDGTDPSRVQERVAGQLKERGEELYVQPVLLDADAQFKDVNTFFLALYMAGFLGISLSAFVIFHSLYVSVQERRGEFAAMRTIGYTSDQLRLLVLYEVLFLSLIGTAAGLLAGSGLAAGLKALLFLLLSIHQEAGTALAAGFLAAVPAGILIPLAASLYPIRKAGRSSVADELRKKTRPVRRRWPLIAGMVLILSGFFIPHLVLLVPLLTGVALVFPYLFRGFVACLKPLYRTLFGFTGELAGRNLSRSLGRTSMTSVILCLGIAMIVLMSSLNAALIQTYERVIHATYGGNLDVMLHHIEPDDLQLLRDTEGVADAVTYPLQAVVWHLNGDKRKLPVYGVGEDWIDRFPLFTSEGSAPGETIRRLASDELLMDRISYQLWGGTVGDRILLETPEGPRSFRVAGVVETMKNSGYGAFMNKEHFRTSFGVKYERNALVLKQEDYAPLQLRENIFDRFGARIEEMFGPEDWVSVISAVYTGSFSVVHLLIILATVISGIGITNTLLMNIMERIRELGMLRAVGVTRSQVVRMVMLEGMGIGAAATLGGILLGTLLLYLTTRFLDIHSLTFPFRVSPGILLLIALFGLAVSLTASLLPAARAAKTKLGEALRYE